MAQQHRRSLHSIHAVNSSFDPKVLEGREVLAYHPKGGERFVSFEDALVLEDHENPERVTRGRIISKGGAVHIKGLEQYRYCELIGVENADDSTKPFLPEDYRGKNPKLVCTTDGGVVGIPIASGVDSDGNHLTYLAPADAFINPPPKHIVEALKDVFNPEGLNGKKLAHPFGVEKVSIEGFPDKEFDFNHYAGDVTINGQQYEEGSYATVRHTDPLYSQLGNLDLAGRMVYTKVRSGDGQRAVKKIVGVVAGVDTFFRPKIIVASAHDLKVK
ncbi:MAG: hypothetical protein GC136_06845 [Alphaproteobacteria bacterium]|nr:hypothetical protein [Alphaproteobacteria bacterium]